MIYLSIVSTSVLMLFLWCITKDPQIKTPLGYAILVFWYLVLMLQLTITYALF